MRDMSLHVAPNDEGIDRAVFLSVTLLPSIEKSILFYVLSKHTDQLFILSD